MALIFELNQLVEMMSIGTLLAYTIVAICVLILRYEDEDMHTKEVNLGTSNLLRQLYNGNRYSYPNTQTSTITKVSIVLFFIVTIIWCLISKLNGLSESIIPLSIIAAVLVIIMLIIYCQPISGVKLSFRVPWVPFLPCLSVFVNLYLMFQLDVNTWVRFVIWLVIGYVIYFGYGYRHSTQIQRNKNKLEAVMRMQHVNNGFEPDYKLEHNKDNAMKI